MYERTGVDSEPKVTRSATSVVPSDMDTDSVRRDPEPAVDGRSVDGVPATIDSYALSTRTRTSTIPPDYAEDVEARALVILKQTWDGASLLG